MEKGCGPEGMQYRLLGLKKPKSRPTSRNRSNLMALNGKKNKDLSNSGAFEALITVKSI
jgi:hypothetical protein